MKRSTLHLLGAGMLASAILCGCQAVGTTTIRGQSPDAPVVQAGHYHQPIKAAASEIRDCYQEHHNTTTTYYGPAGGHCGPGGCRLGHGHGHCPHGYDGGYCPHCPGMGGCPNGHCPGGNCPGCHGCYGGNHLNWYPNHKFSYSYQVPNDLTYPAPFGPGGGAGVGGAIVYPYYTHRGPSDFFRQ